MELEDLPTILRIIILYICKKLKNPTGYVVTKPNTDLLSTYIKDYNLQEHLSLFHCASVPSVGLSLRWRTQISRPPGVRQWVDIMSKYWAILFGLYCRHSYIFWVVSRKEESLLSFHATKIVMNQRLSSDLSQLGAEDNRIDSVKRSL